MNWWDCIKLAVNCFLGASDLRVSNLFKPRRSRQQLVCYCLIFMCYLPSCCMKIQSILFANSAFFLRVLFVESSLRDDIANENKQESSGQADNSVCTLKFLVVDFLSLFGNSMMLPVLCFTVFVLYRT